MRKRLNLLLLVFALLAPASHALAAMSGEELLKRCHAAEKSLKGETLSNAEAHDSMWCMGYVSGLLDGFSLGDFKVGDVKAVCPPEGGISRGDALQAIIRWLREHPEDQRKNGRRGAVIALSRTYGCGAAPVADKPAGGESSRLP